MGRILGSRKGPLYWIIFLSAYQEPRIRPACEPDSLFSTVNVVVVNVVVNVVVVTSGGNKTLPPNPNIYALSNNYTLTHSHSITRTQGVSFCVFLTPRTIV
jgi:hypothetical protein